MSQPNPGSEQKLVKEEVNGLKESSTSGVSLVDGVKPAQPPKSKKSVKNVVKTQSGAKTKALMRSKLHAKTIAKRQHAKQLLKQSEASKAKSKQSQEVSVSGKDSGKQKKQWTKLAQSPPSKVKHMRHFTDAVSKELLHLEGSTMKRRLLSKSTESENAYSKTKNTIKHAAQTKVIDNVDDLQPTIDPFEFTDKEFDFALEHVLCINNENEAEDDDIPLAELALKTKQGGCTYMKAVKFKTQNTVTCVAETKVVPPKQIIKAKSKEALKPAERGAKTKKEKLTGIKKIPQNVCKKGKVPRKRLKTDPTEGTRNETNGAEDIGSNMTNEDKVLPRKLGNKREEIFTSKRKMKEANSASKIPQQKNKQKFKAEERKTEENMKEKSLISGIKPAKRKSKKEASGEEHSAVKRRKTRLSKKLAKEAKKNKMKYDGAPKKTVLSSQDMLNILEDVKNESKLKKKKKTKKVKNDEKVEERTETKIEVKGKRKGAVVASDGTNVPNKKRKVVKAHAQHECQETKEETDSIAEIIDQVARGKTEKPRKIRGKQISATNIKLKIRLKGAVRVIGGETRKMAAKKVAVEALTKGKVGVVKKTLKGRAGARGKKKGVVSNKKKQPVRKRKIDVKKTKTDTNKVSRQNSAADTIDLPHVKEDGAEAKVECNVQIEVKRNPKIKTTDEVKKQLKIGKPKSPPVLNDDFR